MLRVYEEPEPTTMADMKPGDVAEITSGGHAGRVVQYIGDYRWIILGENNGWTNTHTRMAPEKNVRILPPGTLLEVCKGEGD